MLSLLIFDPPGSGGFVLVVAVAWRWFAVPEDARRSEYILSRARRRRLLPIPCRGFGR